MRSKSNALGNQVVRAVISSTDSTGVKEYSFELKKVELMGSGRQNDDWYCRNIKMTIKIYKWREVTDREIVQ